MKTDISELLKLSELYLKKLCIDIRDRSVGSAGNREATSFFKSELKSSNWDTCVQEFDGIDWEDGGAEVTCGVIKPEVFVSPYSNGCDVEGELVSISDPSVLEEINIKGKIVLIHGELAKEQLMPKNFVFYNPVEHRKIIAFLETSKPIAIICVTERNASLAGGVYPFPLIEDGDFDIPSVYMTSEEGMKLLACEGKLVKVRSCSRKIPGKGYNVIGSKGVGSDRIVVTAHIDAKKGTPGAIDNATGVIVLLLLAKLLSDYEGDRHLELVAFNGEDYYAVPGQMEFIRMNENEFDKIYLNINIDGAGYFNGNSAFSFYDVPEKILKAASELILDSDQIVEGRQWPQGDHSIFVQFGRPAIAVSSEWFTENIDKQDITHTSKDNPDIVDVSKLIDISMMLDKFIRRI